MMLLGACCLRATEVVFVVFELGENEVCLSSLNGFYGLLRYARKRKFDGIKHHAYVRKYCDS
jgi:hypothetical protein